MNVAGVLYTSDKCQVISAKTQNASDKRYSLLDLFVKMCSKRNWSLDNWLFAADIRLSVLVTLALCTKQLAIGIYHLESGRLQLPLK